MAKPKQQEFQLKVVGGPHNSVEPYREVDPVTGARIGGQVLFIRSCLRYKRMIGPLGRRWGKTTSRPFLWVTEAAMTKGVYRAAFMTANHVKASEMWNHAKEQLGGLVKDVVGDPETQRRWIDLHPVNIDPAEIGRCYTEDPVVGPRVAANLGKNEGARIYFWSGQHPHYQSVQGVPEKMDRISIDEAQQIHPGATRIVMPMLLDSGGALDVTGIPDVEAIGNTWFKDYSKRADDPEYAGRWRTISFPTYGNPFLDKEALKEIEADLLTEDDVQQYVWAKFISGSGSVFGNLDNVFTIKPAWKKEIDGDAADTPDFIRKLHARHTSPYLRAWVAEMRPEVGHSYAISVDWAGKSRTRDATIMGVYNLTMNRQAAVFQFREDDLDGQLAWCEGLKDYYGAQEVHGDENNGNGVAMGDFLRRRYGTGIIGHKFGAANKGTYVRKGQFIFQEAEISMIDCPAQHREFEDYQRIVGESKSGKDQPVSYSHPPGKHDDFVDSFLQIAPSLALGKRHAVMPEPEAQPMFDVVDRKTTTLERWAEGAPLPWKREDADGLDWTSIVLPPNYR